MGEVAQYEDKYLLCYVRGPEGIIIALAEQLGSGQKRQQPLPREHRLSLVDDD
jgi:hypothetical protein